MTAPNAHEPTTGQQTAEWRTGVSELRGDVPFLYGYDLFEAASAGVNFGAIVLLAFTGEMPTPSQSRMANAMLVMGAAHGISPTGAISRIMAASGVPMQVSVGAAALSVGDYHGGAGEQLARSLQQAQAGHEPGDPVRETAQTVVADFESAGERVPGFGHPMHQGGDPRAPAMLKMASELGVSGAYCELAREVGDVLTGRKSRQIALNVNGASCAILSDLGVSWRFMRVFNITSRTPVLGALAAEEIERERRWRMTASGTDVSYDGPPPRPLPPGWQGVSRA
ncbi:MAG TPA: citrate/2-methylcitrate synthase [Trebonia sp.]|jgi:citrate synthase|nr:citrate/2-methylcitrate synthase [Trebonia sp.]